MIYGKVMAFWFASGAAITQRSFPESWHSPVVGQSGQRWRLRPLVGDVGIAFFWGATLSAIQPWRAERVAWLQWLLGAAVRCIEWPLGEEPLMPWPCGLA